MVHRPPGGGNSWISPGFGVGSLWVGPGWLLARSWNPKRRKTRKELDVSFAKKKTGRNRPMCIWHGARLGVKPSGVPLAGKSGFNALCCTNTAKVGTLTGVRQKRDAPQLQLERSAWRKRAAEAISCMLTRVYYRRSDAPHRTRKREGGAHRCATNRGT